MNNKCFIGKRVIKRGVLIAISLVLLFLVGAFFEVNTAFSIKKQKTADISADELAEIFVKRNGITDYEKIFAPSNEYLYINEIPNEEYLAIYDTSVLRKKKLSQKEVLKISDPIAKRYSEVVLKTGPDTLKKDIDDTTVLYKFQDNFYNYVYCTQNENYYKITMVVSDYQDAYKNLNINTDSINGKLKKSDEELINEFAEVKERLFFICGRQFSDVKVFRSYTEFNEKDVPSTVTLIYYNKSDHYLNGILNMPASDYISVTFLNENENYEKEVTDLFSISYVKHRKKQGKYGGISRFVQKIPLEKAEEYLNKGYVFGGSGCPVCKAGQEDVDFNDYDYVGLVYYYNTGVLMSERYAIPFYAFYKRIADSEEINDTYAVTYVPTFEIEGYEEYFLEKHEKQLENQQKAD